MQEIAALTGIDMTPAGGKHDYYGNLSISGYPDKQTARQFFESYQTIPAQGLGAPTSGTPIDIPLGDLIKAFAPKETVKEIESALEKGKKEIATSGVKIEKGKYLGEEALFLIGKNGARVCQAVLINNFVIMGDILAAYPNLSLGNTPVHSVACQTARKNHQKPGPSVVVSHGGQVVKHTNPTCECNYCKAHPECSTLKAEGFIHREMVKSLLLEIFVRIKGEINEQVKEHRAEIIRGQNQINNPTEKSRIEAGDTIRTDKTTQVNLSDSAGNKISIGGKTEVKINSLYDFKLMVGTITNFIKKLKPMTKFQVHTPTSAVSVRGTAFSLFTDDNVTTLTVIEGEVEFSDLKGNNVIVKDNQSCVCTKEQGLQNPFTLPVNLKEQFREV